MGKITYIDDNNKEYTYTPNDEQEIECAIAYLEKNYGYGADYWLLIEDFNLIDKILSDYGFIDFESDYFEEQALYTHNYR